MKNSKKGLTLVELVVSTIVGLIVITAACSTLYFTMNNYQTGTAAYDNHQNASMAETYLQHNLACAKDINLINSPSVTTIALDLASVPIAPKTELVVMYFSGDTLMIVRRDVSGKLVTARVDGIGQIDLKYTALDTKAKCNYTIHAVHDVHINGNTEKQGFTINGGVVLNNVAGKPADMSLSKSGSKQFLNISVQVK